MINRSNNTHDKYENHENNDHRLSKFTEKSNSQIISLGSDRDTEIYSNKETKTFGKSKAKAKPMTKEKSVGMRYTYKSSKSKGHSYFDNSQ